MISPYTIVGIVVACIMLLTCLLGGMRIVMQRRWSGQDSSSGRSGILGASMSGVTGDLEKGLSRTNIDGPSVVGEVSSSLPPQRPQVTPPVQPQPRVHFQVPRRKPSPRLFVANSSTPTNSSAPTTPQALPPQENPFRDPEPSSRVPSVAEPRAPAPRIGLPSNPYARREAPAMPQPTARTGRESVYSLPNPYDRN